MADRYWRGGAGTWSTTLTTNWSATSNGAGGASVPTVADNVIFDQAATYIVTMTGALTCLNITVSAGIVTFATGTSPTLQVRGSMSLVAATIWNSTGLVTFSSTIPGQTVKTGTATFAASITFNGVGGEWSLGGAITLGVTNTTTLTNGTLTLNGFNLTTGIFSSNNSNVRSIAFGANNIILTNNVSSTVVISMATLTNFSYTGSGGFSNNNIGSTRVYTVGTTAGATSSNAPNFALTTGGSQPAFTTGSWFNKVDYGSCSNSQTSALTLNVNSITLGSAAYTGLTLNLRGSGVLTYNGKTTSTVNLIEGSPTTVGPVACPSFVVNGAAFNFTSGTINPTSSFVVTSGSFTLNGGTLGAVPTFTHTAGSVTFNQNYALAATGTYTLTAGTLTIADGVTVTTGIFLSNNTNIRSIVFGNTLSGNINLAHTTAGTTCLNMTASTNFSRTGPGGFVSIMSVTRTFVAGTTGGSTINAPDLTLSSGGSVPTFTTGSWFNILNFGTSTGAPPAATIVTASKLVLSATGNYALPTWSFGGDSTMTTNGNTTIVNLQLNTVTGTKTFTLTSNVTLAGASTFTQNGSFNVVLNGYTLTVGSYVSNISVARSIAFGANNIVLAHTTASQVVLNMANLTNFTWTGTGGFVSVLSVGRTFTCGTTGGTINTAPNLTLISGASGSILTTGSWFRTLDFGTTSYTSGVYTINVMNFIANNSTGILTSLVINSVGGGVLYTNSTGFGTLNIINGVSTIQSGATTKCITCNATSGVLVIPESTTLTCTGNFTMSGTGKLQNFGTINCVTFNITTITYRMSSGTITPSTSFVVTSGAFNYVGGTVTPTPLFTHTAGSVAFNSNFSLTVNGTYNFTAGTLTLADGVTLTTGIFTDGVVANARSIVFGNRTPGNIHLTHTGGGTTQVLTWYSGAGTQTMSGPGGFTVADMSTTRWLRVGNNCGYPRVTFTTGSSLATLVSPIYLSSLDFGTTSFTPGGVQVKLQGSALGVGNFASGALTLGDGNYSEIILTVTTDASCKSITINTNNKTLTSAGFYIAADTVCNINGPLTITGQLSNFNAGTVYLSNNLTCGSFLKPSSAGVNGQWIGSNTTLTINGGGFTNNGPAPDFGSYLYMTINMIGAAQTFAGNGGVYPTLNNGSANTLTVTGSNYFDNITNSVAPCTFTFPPATQQTLKDFNVNGNDGNIASIAISSGISDGPGFSKPDGIVSVNYLSINRVYATGGATWYAGANSGSVSGSPPAEWIFANPPTPPIYTVSVGEFTIADGGLKISNDSV